MDDQVITNTLKMLLVRNLIENGLESTFEKVLLKVFALFKGLLLLLYATTSDINSGRSNYYERFETTVYLKFGREWAREYFRKGTFKGLCSIERSIIIICNNF